MALSFKEKTVSSTRKRVDGVIQVKDFWGDVQKEFGFRIVSRVEMDDELIKAAAEEIVARYDEAKKKTEESIWASLRLKRLNGNAYIKKTEQHDES
ncbi:hypothetical protein [Phaeodactylibacter sp.]|uniref:hypothetical protein n=1 Tax=Phaeodactylibacter sp. TaxID=1940289 RepID=UPI0025DDEAA7|nr:hypothetical protein [Phaeodactylibacter sp.]MCI4650847.1 hypothetical protein [Phaeodactylibacter sp.]MCI5089804.1 hypothetical protein [Phaeodactylibacter sp.]